MENTETAFDGHQFDAIYPDDIEHHYWTRARNAIIAGALRKGGRRAGRILEVGCGRGVVVAALRSRGFEVEGVELARVNPLPAAAAHVRTGVDALALPVAERAAYDTLLLLDVLEHLPAPAEFLRRLRESFPNAHRVVATVPARMELFSNWDELNRHFRRYDRPTVRQLVAEAGGELVRLAYFCHALWLPARLTLMFNGKRASQINPPRGRLAIGLHRALAWCLCAEHRLLPGVVAGTSLIFEINFPAREQSS
jgi:SAM-dependent methyltransferase